MKMSAFPLLLMLSCMNASAQQFFAGTWHVVKAEVAPWVPAGSKPQPAAEAAFAHAVFEFRTDRVAGPAWTACRKPKYDLTPQPFDSLFEGGLYDPEHGLNDAKAAAERLGFQREPVPSMTTGCSELLFHQVDGDTTLFGLNNMIYTMKREHK